MSMACNTIVRQLFVCIKVKPLLKYGYKQSSNYVRKFKGVKWLLLIAQGISKSAASTGHCTDELNWTNGVKSSRATSQMKSVLRKFAATDLATQ